MIAMKWLGQMLLCSTLSIGLALPTFSDPATPKSTRIATYGNWAVVQKPATYVIAGTGQTGRYTLCSAAFFASNASLEFEAKNDVAWSVYVAAQGWRYQNTLKSMTIKSGSQEIRIGQAVYGGPMISAASHNLNTGQPISIETLKRLMAQRQPISIHDNRGRKLVSFPNNGEHLEQAFAQAVKCSMSKGR